MPKIALQQPYAKFHGKAAVPGQPGGQVLFSVGQANYARALVTPANPNSAHQIAVKSVMTSVANGYQALSTAVADAWVAAAANVTRTNPVGGKYKFTGIALYSQINYWRLVAGLGLDSTVPSLDTVAAPSSITSATVNGGDLDIVLVHNTAITVNSFFIRVTQDLGSNARRARKSDLQTLSTGFIDSLFAVTASPMTASVPIQYFSITAGMNIGIEVTPISQGVVPGTPLFDTNVLVA